MRAEEVGFINGFALGQRWAQTMTQEDMAAFFRRPRTTIRDCIARAPGAFTVNKDNWGHVGHQQDRIRAMEERQEIVAAEIMEDRTLTRTELRALLKTKYKIDICDSTLFYDLHAGFFAWRPRRLVPYDKDPEKWRETRLEFARHWLSVIRTKRSQGIAIHFIFTDESIFRCSHKKGWEWCHWSQQPSEVAAAQYTCQCHAWGAMSDLDHFRCLVNLSDRDLTGPRGGVTSDDYTAMLKAAFLKKWKRLKTRYPNTEVYFVQDGARIHTSKSSMEWFEDNDVAVMTQWPPPLS